MSADDPVGTIIIAAHNEASVIGRCLDSLGEVIATGQVRVVVVCNGCVDATAEIARSRRRVIVLELATASKVAALRAGDDSAAPGPRIYLDADVVMTGAAALAVLDALAAGAALAARPPVRFDTAGAQWPVRAWYAVRIRLPSIRRVLWGAGTYALSVEGRGRFAEFPDIVSDDLFIDSLFGAQETVIVDTDPVVVHTPRQTTDLLRILIRTYRTQHEVRRGNGAGAVSAGQRGQLRDLLGLVVARPLLAPAIVTYVVLIVAARLRARRSNGAVAWERDDSSRSRPGG